MNEQETESVADVPQLSDAELRQLAIDVVEGRVFGSWQCAPIDVCEVFVPLAFCDSLPKNAGSAYEYLDKAGPRCFNGYPSFFSCKFLATEDTPKLQELLRELSETRKKFLATKE